MLKEFKEFAMRGNVIDMAIGIILGAAFGKIVTSLVSDILMPPIGLLLGKVDFSSLFLNLSGQQFSSLANWKVERSKVESQESKLQTGFADGFRISSFDFPGFGFRVSMAQ